MATVEEVLAAKGRQVHGIEPDATVLTALEKMAAEGIGGLVVLDADGRIAGMVTERDYARKVILQGRMSKDTAVREIMTRKVLCVAPHQEIETCMALMTEHRVRHLPVLDGERLVGLISIGDVVKAIIEKQRFTIEQLEHYIRGG